MEDEIVEPKLIQRGIKDDTYQLKTVKNSCFLGEKQR